MFDCRTRVSLATILFLWSSLNQKKYSSQFKQYLTNKKKYYDKSLVGTDLRWLFWLWLMKNAPGIRTTLSLPLGKLHIWGTSTCCWAVGYTFTVRTLKCHLRMREFSGDPVVTIWYFHCRGPFSVPGQGTKVPQARQHSQIKCGTFPKIIL